jgi:hypothetical protein
MKKILKTIVFTWLALTVSITACNLIALTPPSDAPTVTASPIVSPSPIVTFTESVPTASATPEFAPFCVRGAEVASTVPACEAPSAEESSTYCSEKDPYSLILVGQGLTYEVLTDGFKCLDSGTKDGKQLIACTGPLASDFVLNVCDPSCVVPTVQAALKNCPTDYTYNSAQGCCTNEIQTLSQNCTTFKFRTTTCVIRCFEYKKEAKCKKNSWACVWNDKDKVCEVRK